MNTHPDTLRVLEWPEVCAQLAAFAFTPWGRTRLLELLPLADPESQRSALGIVQECLDRIRQDDPVPLWSVEEFQPSVHKAGVEGAQLDGKELNTVAEFCKLVNQLVAYRRHLPETSALSQTLAELVPATAFCKNVEAALDTDGAVKDDASPALRRLGKHRRQLERTLLARLEKTAARFGDNSVVTQREGRYVVSVPDRHKGEVPGLVHDRSQTGTTFYIEPLAVLDLGNELRDTEADIRDEIRRILLELTRQLRELVPDISHNVEAVAEVDFAFAKARWAARCGAHAPSRSDRPELCLLQGRHPLLVAQQLGTGQSLQQVQDTVVPFDLRLDDQQQVLIISGPNTGGKTVCLKATGLAILLVHAGVPIPAAPETLVGTFDAVYADIGDDQSLALSLSTFSAHLKHVGFACRNATSSSLVLLDELGVGTDPEEGGALAKAVVATLLERGTRLVLTTHYNDMKLLSQDDKRVENGAFLFDETDLAPTYELVVGRPGQSYALDVARRLNFPEQIVALAEGKISRETRKMTELITRLSEQEREAKSLRARLEEKESRLDALLSYNREAEERWTRLQSKAEVEARREAAKLVADTRRETEKLVRDLRMAKADPGSVKRAHRTLEELAQRASLPKEEVSGEGIGLGTTVSVAGVRDLGQVTRVSPDGQRVWVQIGNVSYTVSPDRLTPVAPVEVAAHSTPKVLRTDNEPDEIDLRGKTVDEAQMELDVSLEALSSQGVAVVRVIHGRGTGVLRRELSAWFKRHPLVESARLGGRGEGGDGVTVLTLKPT
jgi:DNA mismatch repair protein MutS2